MLVTAEPYLVYNIRVLRPHHSVRAVVYVRVLGQYEVSTQSPRDTPKSVPAVGEVTLLVGEKLRVGIPLTRN